MRRAQTLDSSDLGRQHPWGVGAYKVGEDSFSGV